MRVAVDQSRRRCAAKTNPAKTEPNIAKPVSTVRATAPLLVPDEPLLGLLVPVAPGLLPEMVGKGVATGVRGL